MPPESTWQLSGRSRRAAFGAIASFTLPAAGRTYVAMAGFRLGGRRQTHRSCKSRGTMRRAHAFAHASTRHSAEGGGKLSLARWPAHPDPHHPRFRNQRQASARSASHPRARCRGRGRAVEPGRVGAARALAERNRERPRAGRPDRCRADASGERVLGVRTRPRPAWQRDAMPLGIAVSASRRLRVRRAGVSRPAQRLRLHSWCGSPAPHCVLIGVLALSARYIASFTGAPLDRAYSTLGLYVSQLHDRHPWLYETLSVARHEAADEYRCKVLNERGLLRGADYVLMCEIVHVHEALDRARPGELRGRGAAAPARPFAACRRRREGRAASGAGRRRAAWSGLRRCCSTGRAAHAGTRMPRCASCRRLSTP